MTSEPTASDGDRALARKIIDCLPQPLSGAMMDMPLAEERAANMLAAHLAPERSAHAAALAERDQRIEIMDGTNETITRVFNKALKDLESQAAELTTLRARLAEAEGEIGELRTVVVDAAKARKLKLAKGITLEDCPPCCPFCDAHVELHRAAQKIAPAPPPDER